MLPAASVSYCCITSHPKTEWLKMTATFLAHGLNWVVLSVSTGQLRYLWASAGQHGTWRLAAYLLGNLSLLYVSHLPCTLVFA